MNLSSLRMIRGICDLSDRAERPFLAPLLARWMPPRLLAPGLFCLLFIFGLFGGVPSIPGLGNLPVLGGQAQAQSLGPGDESLSPEARTILDSGPEGLRALTDLLRHESLPYMLWENPLTVDLAEAFPLLLIPGPLYPLKEAEARLIYRFVENGGRVIYSPLYVPGKAAPAYDALLNQFGLNIPELARTFTVDGRINRYKMSISPIYQSALPEGTVVMRGGRRLRWQGKSAENHHILLQDEWGMGAVAIAHGAGMFIALSDLSPLGNRWLAEVESAGFIIGLIRTYQGSGPVGIDIYHHGMQASQGPFTRLFESHYGYLLLHLLALTGFFLWYYAARQVPIAPADESPQWGP